MNTNFCSSHDIPKRIYKCCSLKKKKVFVFLSIYFIENGFSKDDKVTWLKNGERLYGTIDKVSRKISVKEDKSQKKSFKLPEQVNRVHIFDTLIGKIYENIKNGKRDFFEGCNKTNIDKLKGFIGDKDIVEELFPLSKEGFEHVFIFDQMIYEDDTTENVLKKISNHCSDIDFESYKFIYASYFNSSGETLSLGFEYKDEKVLHSNDLITKDLCDIFEEEKKQDGLNIIEKKYEELIENFDIKDNIIYFINFEDFIDHHELNTIDFKKCSNDDHDLNDFKTKIINKYWPHLINEKMETIIGRTDDKKDEFLKEKERLNFYTRGNLLIHGNIDKTHTCDEAVINYFKKTKRQDKSLTVDLFKLFTDLRLNERVPFVKWISGNNDNKYYKLYKDSILYEGYDETSENIGVDFPTCREWIKDLYRSKKRSLEKINRYDVIHKEDIISFKIFSQEGFYCDFAIHIDGTLDFIIKKDKENKGITSKKGIIDLIKSCNDLIRQLNDEKKYSEDKLIDFGTDEEIEEIFFGQTIDFIDAKISYKKSEYEVKNGIENEDEKREEDKLLPPFVKGEKTKLFIPILRKVCNNLSMFFRYMNEEDDENIPANIIGLQYNRSSNFTNSNTIQSLITVYLNKGVYQEENKIINDITKVFNVTPDFVRQEISSIKEIESEKEKYRKTTVVDEDTPDITISVRSNYLDFEVRNMKSFMEFQRITSLTKVIMSLFKKFVNDDNIFEERFLGSLFKDDTLNVKSEIIDEEVEQVNVQDLLANIDSDSSTLSSSESSMENASEGSSMEEADGGGQMGGAALRSYYLKRLKENDKKLFDPDKPWIVKQKNGDLYGYAKQCGAAIDRHPVSITTEELKRINNYDTSISGKESYSKSITVPRRNQGIHYICPQYWDISREIPLKKEYVDKHKKDIIKDKQNKENNTILERKGKYWDGIPNEDSYKHILPGFSKLIIHPEGYQLPCCFSKRGLEKEYSPQDPQEEEEEEQPKPKKEIKKGPKKVGEKLCKINTKETLPISVGQCSQLPKKLKEMLTQDKIFEYDPNLSVSNGFIRKGVKQNENDYVFKESSFINSLIELLDYKEDSKSFIENEIIKPIVSNIEYYQYCPSLHKLFRKKTLIKNDKDYIKKELLTKKSFRNKFGEDDTKTLSNLLSANEEKFNIKSAKISYMYSLVLSLKTYIDFLKSDEEKKDEYIIPILNSILRDKVNIIVFEKFDERIKIKRTEQNESDNYCFMIKDGHYYEPIVYRVNMLKEQHEVKVLSRNIFNTFEYFSKETFKKVLVSPYPRGRDPKLRHGITETKIENLKTFCKNAKYCTEWLPYEKNVKKGIELRWIENDVENCPNSGKKNYAKFVGVEGDFVVTDIGKVKKEIVFVKTTKQVAPQLKEGLKSKTSWLWIERDCDNIHDKDIEALIRKKYDKEGDKLLLDLSMRSMGKLKDEDELLTAVSSHFFIINRIINDLEKLKGGESIQYLDIENKGVKHYINNYSEITHVLYERDDGNILLPIKPVKITPENKNLEIIYEVKDYPQFNFVKEYLKRLDINIQKIIQNKEGKGVCLFVKDGMIPIIPEEIKGTSKYETFKSEINPFEVDKLILNIENMKENYTQGYKSKLDQKHKLFTRLLNLIKNGGQDEVIMGIIEEDMFERKSHKVKKIVRVLTKNIVGDIDKEKFKLDQKLLEEFSYRLIISVENGNNISTINKIIDNVVKYSDLEKNTPDTEIFIKFLKDKEKMYDSLRDIFIRQSNFINISEEMEYSLYKKVKTTKLKTTPYYITKLFGPEASIIFNIDGTGGDWWNLSDAFKELGLLPDNYGKEINEIRGVETSSRRKISFIGPIQRIILYKLSELNNDETLKDKRDIFIKEYNKYNILRYGGKHDVFTNITDIMKYWRKGSGEERERRQKINRPDIELVLERVKEEYVHGDETFGVLLISFSNGKEMNIKFYGSKNIYDDTKIVLLHHTLYNGDYVLSNIHVGGRKFVTVKQLFDLSEHHKKWINVKEKEELTEEKKEELKEFYMEKIERLDYAKEFYTKKLESLN